MYQKRHKAKSANKRATIKVLIDTVIACQDEEFFIFWKNSTTFQTMSNHTH